MQLFYRDLENIKTLEINDDCTLNDLKLEIEDETFIPSDLMYLTSNAKILNMGYIKDQVNENDIIEIMLELKGGMRAKWRKKRMRRMRRLRRKMRQRAR